MNSTVWKASRRVWHRHLSALASCQRSSSWLNLVERWFCELSTEAIRRGVFYSVADLKSAIDAYLTARNDDPKPFVWTATVESIAEKLTRCRQTLPKIQPGCTIPRIRKKKKSSVQLFRTHSTSNINEHIIMLRNNLQSWLTKLICCGRREVDTSKATGGQGQRGLAGRAKGRAMRAYPWAGAALAASLLIAADG